jgi:N-acetyl-anhydromuramyl-L-alanine amidase AmpD
MPKNPNPRRRYKKRKLKKISKLVLHCDDWDADIMTIANYDVTPHPQHHISKKGCPGFTYHYFIEKDGTVKYAMDLKEITWHAGNHNGKSIGVCIRYRATGNPNPPPKVQLTALQKLLARLCLDLCIDPDNIKGHRELFGTGYKVVNGKKKLRKTCPGMLVNLDEMRYVVSMAVQQVLAGLGLYTGRIDGDFGPKSEAALERHRKNR